MRSDICILDSSASRVDKGTPHNQQQELSESPECASVLTMLMDCKMYPIATVNISATAVGDRAMQSNS